MVNQIVQERINQLEPLYRDIVLGDFIKDTSKIFTANLHLDEVKMEVFKNGLFLYFLLFFHKYELALFFVKECTLTCRKALTIVELIETGLPNELTSSMNIARINLENNDISLKEKDRLDVLNNITTEKKIQYLYLLSQDLSELNKISKVIDMVIFGTLIGDIILGFYKIEDTVPLLQQELGLDPKTAALLGAEVLEFLAPLSDPNWQPPVEAGDDEGTGVADDTNIVTEPEISRIPIKSPALFDTSSTPESVAIPAPVPQPAPVVNPVTSETPVYQPTPASYVSTPTPTPVYHSTQPVTTPTPAAPAPLSTIPSYTPAPIPPTPAAPAPAPDRPRWSTEI